VKTVEGEHKLLVDSIKRLDDDIRKTEKILVEKEKSKVKYQGLIDELALENDNEY